METSFSPLVVVAASGLMLLGVMTLTSFVKLSVVFMIVRQAIGLQQVPSNMILLTLAILLSVFVSMPVFREALNAVNASDLTFDTVDGLVAIWNAAVAPFQRFISNHIDPEYIDFFTQTATDLWAGSGIVGDPDDFIIQLPAFIISELTEAFKIGFLLYLPFVAIDLSVTTILMALGMQMVQPNIISVPFKLLLFVYVDGWARMVEGLLLSYQV